MRKNSIQNSVTIIGAGQMGSGIAQLFAMHGFSVILIDVSDIALRKAITNITASLEKLKSKQEITEYTNDVLSRISTSLDISACADSKIIIESAFEDFGTKFGILNSINQYVDNTTYVATNTSSFSVSDLAKAVSYPENFLGFHFMNPVVLMNLVEIVSGVLTSESTVHFFKSLSSRLKKTGVCVKNSPGFVLNRILIPMINEAVWTLYEDISTAEEIDQAMQLGANHKIGPLALADLIGLDTVMAILRTLQQIDVNKYAPCPLLQQYVAANKLGRKSGVGFYSYV